MVLIKERIGKLLEYLGELVYPDTMPIDSYRMLRTEEKFTDLEQLDTSQWESFQKEQIWGGHREYYWFETTVEIPECMAGKCVVYELITGQEGQWDATNPQFSLYVNGTMKQGLDVNHRESVLTENASKGERFHIVLSAFTGDQNFNLKLDSRLKVLDRRTEKYYYDLLVPYNVARMLDSDDKAYLTIISCLNESLNRLDLRKEHSKEYYDSLKEAQDYITREFYEKECGNSEAAVYCVGHTHIDVAWLWSLKVTEDKAVRSFSTVLDMMKQYPEYIFMSSQPQLYKYVKKNAPGVYEEIKKRITEGRWEPEGGMFVEADCNIASGEALIRQFLHGQRFFRDEFGKDNSILWLPDVFGYSAALPQIMNKCGLRYFMTTKISWNEFNKMPYDTFEWEGIDGSRVLTHFIPARDYNKAAVEGGTETQHFTTYNGYINPSQVKGGWKRYSQKYLNDEVLMSFGYGDGGGGPTPDMLENYRRLEKGIPGCPRTVMSTAKDFFSILENKVKNHKYLPSWSGELYLEYHRGTYTSMARNKRYNRKSEFAYMNAELYGVLADILSDSTYPKEEIKEAWEVILRNQFHDILPGSSIKEVYDDSREEYEGILETNKILKDKALTAVASRVGAPQNSILVFNPNSNPASDITEFRMEGCRISGVLDGNVCLPVQRTEEGTFIFKANNVPGKGYKTFYPADSESGQGEQEASELVITCGHMENQFFSIDINEYGQFSRIYHKTAGREVLRAGEAGNVLMSYEDRPHNYDAWDVNNYYTEKAWEVNQTDSITVAENGPVRGCLMVKRKYLDSVIQQYIYIYKDIPRIDIRNEIDWKEHQIFVKALFPVDIHTNEASFDIQYGNVKRNTHYNTSWDYARFEVCVHKWLDVSEDGYGVSVLNDCKYGCSVHDGVIGISMLKSPIYPNPEADKEHHTFTYSIYPHEGGWREAQTVNQAYQLNNPLEAVIKNNDGGELNPVYGLVSSSAENVIVEAVKKAEDEDAYIIRLYECCNRRTHTQLTFGQRIASVCECNMMEEENREAEFEGNKVQFTIYPYEIKTFKLTF